MFTTACALIDSIAPEHRVLVFVMYKFQLELVEIFLKEKYKGIFLLCCYPNRTFNNDALQTET